MTAFAKTSAVLLVALLLSTAGYSWGAGVDALAAFRQVWPTVVGIAALLFGILGGLAVTLPDRSGDRETGALILVTVACWWAALYLFAGAL